MSRNLHFRTCRKPANDAIDVRCVTAATQLSIDRILQLQCYPHSSTRGTLSSASLPRGPEAGRTVVGMKVEIHSSLEKVGVDRWNSLMAGCGAPVFYYSSFLTAFERLPL